MHFATPRLRRLAVTTALTCFAATGIVTGATEAAAAPVSAFYHPPEQFATAPGSIIRTEPTSVYATIPGDQWPVPGQLVMYTSRLQDGSPVAVTGTYVAGTRPWQGAGNRPTIVIAPGTAGQGDQCAASVAVSTGLIVDVERRSMSPNQEAVALAAWSALGANVFITDYIGLGTPGIHTYVNRAESAHAVLDAARAAVTLAGTGTSTPLAFWGYSQGGGATAAAAELHPEYAPELNLKGVWAGAPPADLTAVIGQIDSGNLIGGAIGFALNGFRERHPALAAEVDRRTTPAGKATLDALATQCIGDVILRQPFLRSSALTIDGRPLPDHLRELPGATTILTAQRIGNRIPTAPVLLTSGINDDTIPYPQVRQLAQDWCAHTTTVTFRTNHLPAIAPGTTLPNHFGPELIDGFVDNVIPYLLDRLADKPLSGCTFD
ncbi:lipase family protein [Nocardia sp. XZ_19_385]|uniref:lipase family protein n=1 Tax=Nocardia sp. XZ_19_385 TaxID=2769488 RepID=UPI00188F56C5|nr:lipase family protein [Nocardia sp. XZ_19_385]